MPDSLTAIRRERATVHRAYLALCQSLAQAIVRQPAAVPDLLESWHARYAERTALDLRLASYEAQASLFDDLG